jgi:hypothetical protein
MIELTPTGNDDPGFLSLTKRMINGAASAHEVRDVFLVHIDSWFDHKWLGWWSWKGNGLCVPPFTPRRVISQRRFLRIAEPATWTSAAIKRPLHIRQPGRSTRARPLDRYSQDAAFAWYSGSTTTNTLGCLMFYRTGTERYAWYASMGKKTNWAIVETCQISPGELRSFEERGRELETAEAGPPR